MSSSHIGGLEKDLAWIREQCEGETEKDREKSRAINVARASRIESRLRIMKMNLDDAAKAGRKLAAESFKAEREIESLRAERDALAQARDFLAAKLNAANLLADRWDSIAADHGVRAFTGNDHKLFANELRAALYQATQQEQES